MDLDAVKAAQARLHRAQESLGDARRALLLVAHQAAQRIAEDGTPDQRMEAIRYLYWQVPDLNTKEIESVFELPLGRTHEIAGPGPILGRCADCGEVMRARSRTHAAQGTRSGYPDRSRCRACRRARDDAQSEEWQRKSELQQRRIAELQRMSFEDFARTPEWQRRLAIHREWGGPSVCLLCEQTLTVGPYLRATATPGGLRDGDLEFLCSECGNGLVSRGLFVAMPVT